MGKLRIICAVAVLGIQAMLCVQAQTLEWQLNANGFFDNSEGDDAYRTTMTHSGLRLSPEVGISLDDSRHTLMAGYSGLAEWGHKRGFTDGDLIAYYRYSHAGFRFLLGSFSRDRLIGDYPTAMISDTVRYYRPMIQGFAFQYQGDGGHIEAFLDWTSSRTDTQREQFMAGFSLRRDRGRLSIGTEGYYYHYALTWGADESQHIHDYFVARPYIGYSLLPPQQGRLDIRLGALLSLDRERGDSWNVPVGFMAEADAEWHNIVARQTVYAGDNQQHYGSAHFGQYYWGDTYYQSHFYSRTDVKYRFIRSSHVEALAGAVFNVTGKGLNWHQMLTLRFSIGGNRQSALSK